MGGRQLARVRRKLGLKRIIGGGPIAQLTAQLAGGKKFFMECAKLAVQIEPRLACVSESYERLNRPSLRAAVPLDELCAMHGIDPRHYIGVVGEAALRYENNSAILLIALSMPEVVNRSIKEALKPEGVADRKMLFQHAGIIPVPAGQTINVKATANAAAKAETITETRKALPSFEQSMMESDAILRGRE